MVVAIDMANYSAKAAFSLSTDAIAGKATHFIAGNTSGISEGIYKQLRTDLGIQ